MLSAPGRKWTWHQYGFRPKAVVRDQGGSLALRLEMAGRRAILKRPGYPGLHRIFLPFRAGLNSPRIIRLRAGRRGTGPMYNQTLVSASTVAWPYEADT